jgi:hypothetical protein
MERERERHFQSLQVTGLLPMHTNIWRLNSDSEATRSCLIDENNMIGPGDIAWSMHVRHSLVAEEDGVDEAENSARFTEAAAGKMMVLLMMRRMQIWDDTSLQIQRFYAAMLFLLDINGPIHETAKVNAVCVTYASSAPAFMCMDQSMSLPKQEECHSLHHL